VADLRAEMLATALGRFSGNMTRAADTIAGLLDDPDPALRLRAARTLLTVGLRLHEAVDVAERLRVLEGELGRREDFQ
jgi:hypothetical protein